MNEEYRPSYHSLPNNLAEIETVEKLIKILINQPAGQNQKR